MAALAGLAWIVSFATEQIGERFGPAVTELRLDTMGQSDSRSARYRFLSLRHPSCLALVVSAAGTLRASSVSCVCLSTRHALRPRQAFESLTFNGSLSIGFGLFDTIPAGIYFFRG